MVTLHTSNNRGKIVCTNNATAHQAFEKNYMPFM